MAYMVPPIKFLLSLHYTEQSIFMIHVVSIISTECLPLLLPLRPLLLALLVITMNTCKLFIIKRNHNLSAILVQLEEIRLCINFLLCV